MRWISATVGYENQKDNDPGAILAGAKLVIPFLDWRNVCDKGDFKDFDKLLDQELSQTIRITDNGQTLPMTKRELLIKTLVNGALKGDRAALKLVFGFMKTQHTVEGFVPDASDHAALMALMEKTQLGEEEPEEPPNG